MTGATGGVGLGGRYGFGGNYPVQVAGGQMMLDQTKFTNAFETNYGGLQGNTSWTIDVDDPNTPVQIGGLNAVQQIAFPSQPSGGTWTLSLTVGGTTYTSGTLSPTAAAGDVQSALNSLLAGIGVPYSGGSVNVTTSGNAYTYLVTFNGGTLQAADVPTLSFSGSGGIATATVLTTVEGGQGLNEANQMMSLAKWGAGTLVLGGSDGYSGNTTVYGGVLRIRNSNSFGVGTANVAVISDRGGNNQNAAAGYHDGMSQLQIDGSLGPVNVTNRGLDLSTDYASDEAAGNSVNYSGIVDNVAGSNSWTNLESSEQQAIDFHTTSAMTGSFAVSMLNFQTGAISATGTPTQVAAAIQTALNSVACNSPASTAPSVIVTPDPSGSYKFYINWAVYNSTPTTGNTQYQFRDQAQSLVQVDMTGITSANPNVTVSETSPGMSGFGLHQMDTNGYGPYFIGAASGSSLTLNGNLFATDTAYYGNDGEANVNIPLLKTGGGSLTLAGDGANDFGGSLDVLDGTLVLNKQSLAFLPNNPKGAAAFGYGGVNVGDAYLGNSGGINPGVSPKTTPDVLVQAFPEEIPNATANSVTVYSTGQYQFSSALSGLFSNEVQRVTPPGPQVSWTLSFEGSSANIVAGSTPFMVQQAFDTLLGNPTGSTAAGEPYVRVSGVPNDNVGPYYALGSYYITFLGTLGGASQPLIAATNPSPATSGVPTVTELVAGGLQSQSLGTLTTATGTLGSPIGPLPAGFTLALGTDPTFAVQPGVTTAASTTISGQGRLALLPYTAVNGTAAATRNFYVQDTSAANDLVVNVPIDSETLSNEIQTITFPSSGPSGSWTIGFGGQNTGTLAASATAAQVQAALNGLSTVSGTSGSGSVSVTETTSSSAVTYTVIFEGSLGASAQNLLTVTGGTVAETRKGGCSLNNETQIIAFSAAPTGTSWTITYGAQTTTTLAPTAAASSVAAALNALNNIGGSNLGGSVSVTTLGNVYTYQVTFGGGLMHEHLGLLQVNPSNLTGSPAPAIVETVPGGWNPADEEQQINLDARHRRHRSP